jgi:hypothetical protein
MRTAGLDPDACPHRAACRWEPWEPRKLRLRVLSATGRIAASPAAAVGSGSASPAAGPGPDQITAGITRIQALAPD